MDNEARINRMGWCNKVYQFWEVDVGVAIDRSWHEGALWQLQSWNWITTFAVFDSHRMRWLLKCPGVEEPGFNFRANHFQLSQDLLPFHSQQSLNPSYSLPNSYYPEYHFSRNRGHGPFHPYRRVRPFHRVGRLSLSLHHDPQPPFSLCFSVWADHPLTAYLTASYRAGCNTE